MPTLRLVRGGVREPLEELEVALARSELLYRHQEALLRVFREGSTARFRVGTCPCDLCAFASNWFDRRRAWMG